MIVVVPFARQAAIIISSVAPTLGNESVIFVPQSPFGTQHSRYPCFSRISAPISRSELRCKSIGLEPISHPPGNEILALPVRARIAPRKTIELLVLRINSTGTSKRLISSHFTRSVLSQRVAAQPRYRRMLTDASTSESEGQLWITFSPFVRIEAAIIGKALFFAP